MPEEPARPLYGHIELLLLAAVRSRPSHGLAIIEELHRKSRGEFTLATGTVYPALHRLEAEGFLSSQEVHDAETGRPRVIYQITSMGRQKLGEKTANWKRFSGALGEVLDNT